MNDFLNVMVAQSPAKLNTVQERLTWLEQKLQSIEQGSIDLFILPELFLTGYNVGDKLLEGITKTSEFFRIITLLAKKYTTAIHFGYPEKKSNELYNSSSCISKTGTILGTHRKLLLPPGFESKYFSMGSDYQTFTIGSFTIGTLICYDAEFPENFRQLAKADLVVVPTALTAQWSIVANKIIPSRAFENGVYVCYANHSGVENGIQYYGGSCIIAPDGNELARAGKQEELIIACLNTNEVKKARERLPYHNDRLRLPV